MSLAVGCWESMDERTQLGAWKNVDRWFGETETGEASREMEGEEMLEELEGTCELSVSEEEVVDEAELCVEVCSKLCIELCIS